jgi:hypothetical protein
MLELNAVNQTRQDMLLNVEHRISNAIFQVTAIGLISEWANI